MVSTSKIPSINHDTTILQHIKIDMTCECIHQQFQNLSTHMQINRGAKGYYYTSHYNPRLTSYLTHQQIKKKKQQPLFDAIITGTSVFTANQKSQKSIPKKISKSYLRKPTKENDQASKKLLGIDLSCLMKRSRRNSAAKSESHTMTYIKPRSTCQSRESKRPRHRALKRPQTSFEGSHSRNHSMNSMKGFIDQEYRNDEEDELTFYMSQQIDLKKNNKAFIPNFHSKQKRKIYSRASDCH